jgi:tetratricopeptide (TPR) repeat protein
MIQPLKTPRNTWRLHWLDLSEPVPTGGDWFLPTLVVVLDRNGSPVGPPEIMEELDQARIESMLYRLIENSSAPDQLLVPESDDWNHPDWQAFSSECKLEIRFHAPDKSLTEELHAVTRLVVSKAGRPGGNAAPLPAEIAAGLVRTARRLHSQEKRESVLRAALDKAPDCSPARIELADIEFNKGNWKSCAEAYSEVVRRGAYLRQAPVTAWWTDHATRPYLRALYGQAMTDWHLARYNEAAATLTDLIACNPADNQGARFLVPMLHLLAEQPAKAAKYFSSYAKKYPDDFHEPSFHFGWAFCASVEGRETVARSKYVEGILRNIYIAPMLLEVPEPPKDIWFPNDRAEPSYASEFLQSYAVLWDREPAALRILREVWQDIQKRVAALVRHRELMVDFQDQRYDPDYKARWQELCAEDDRLSKP